MKSKSGHLQGAPHAHEPRDNYSRQQVITGTIKTQIDQIWNAFWSGGVSNPLSVIEQLTFLMFIKRLDDLQTVEERKSEDLGLPIARRIFPEGADDKGEPYDNLRWSRFKHFEAREMMLIVDEHVFPFLRQLERFH